jgi:putative membrane protein
MHFLVRLLINAAALWVAARVAPGISFQGPWTQLLAVALVFGVLNAGVRPLLKILTFPFLIITLGLFTFVTNAVMLLLTGWAAEVLGLGFRVSGFRAAFLGGLVIALVSLMLSIVVSDGPSIDVRVG